MRIKIKLRENPIKVGTKFRCKDMNDDSFDDTIYTISDIRDNKLFVEWTENGDTTSVLYSVQEVKDIFSRGNWVVYDKD